MERGRASPNVGLGEQRLPRWQQMSQEWDGTELWPTPWAPSSLRCSDGVGGDCFAVRDPRPENPRRESAKMVGKSWGTQTGLETESSVPLQLACGQREGWEGH